MGKKKLTTMNKQKLSELHLSLKKKYTQLKKIHKDQINKNQQNINQIIRELKTTSNNPQEEIIKNILPVVDSLELTLKSCSEKKPKEGLRITLQLMRSILKNKEVKKIDPKRFEEFNPNFHQAIISIKSQRKPNLIFGVLQKGYIMINKVLRPALVSVTVKQ